MDEQTRQLANAREREAATREILRVISRSPGDYAPVFQTILDNAIRLCSAPLGILYLVRDGHLHVVADAGPRPEFLAHLRANPIPLLDGTSKVTGAAARERVPKQIADLADLAYRSGNARVIGNVEIGGVRTLLGVPILNDGETVGVIALYRQEVKPFADDDIELVSTFADQAVIAIENVRQFQALQARTADLTKSLERQTATSEILRAISRSPTDYAPIFETILENAMHLCEAPLGTLFLLEDDGMKGVKTLGGRPEFLEFLRVSTYPVDDNTVVGRAALAKASVQVADITADSGRRNRSKMRKASIELEGIRTLLAVPLLKNDEVIGAIALYRREVMPFDDDQVALVGTFANQAVIAIENVRLFRALQTRTTDLGKSLEQQTASSDILRRISRSRADYNPVFKTILENAVRLCGAPFGALFLLRDGFLHVVANVGGQSELIEHLQANPLALDEPNTLLCQAARAREPRQLVDMMDDAYRSGDPRRLIAVDRFGIRTWLCVPLLQGDEVMGVIGLYRQEVKAFADDEIELVCTFADQAVIAIENVRQFQQVQTRTADLTVSLERQTATSEILRSISRSPTDYDPVFQTILDNAIRLCGAPFGTLFLLRDDQLHVVADAGSEPEMVEHLRLNPIPLDETSAITSRAVNERVALQQDLMDEHYHSGDPRRLVAVDRFGIRTWLCVPMLKGDEVVGAIGLYRKEAEPYADDDIALVSTFADQAVIAIENVRMFQALEGRTTDLTKSLERQTATSEILRSISASPTDYDPVFDTILENATRLCGAPLGILYLLRDGHLQLVADAGSRPEYIERLRANPRSLDNPFALSSRTAKTQETIQIADLIDEAQRLGDPSRLAGLKLGGVRTVVGVPMLKGKETVGVIALYRQEVKPFADDDIDLVRTFADQAVIAIENVRQFQVVQERTADLTQSLERQTATSEILRSISQSPTDYAPVFDTILENATRLCGAPFGILYLLRDDHLHLVANVGARPEYVEYMLASPPALNNPNSATTRAAKEQVPRQLTDLSAAAARSGDPVLIASLELEGISTVCAVPMLKGAETVGVIALYRREIKAFEDDDIALVSTFADQAVIAIENVRLFQALESRNSALGESLERQTATSEILRAISRSPTDYQPVFDTILENATRLCDAPLGQLLLIKDGGIHSVANRGGRPEFIEFSRNNIRPADRKSGAIGRALTERKPIHTEDITSEALYRDGDKYRVAAVELEGIRSLMTVPLLKGEEGIGVIVLYRREVRQFEERHVSLLETFADQAVIAIENVRLFQALEGRTADLTKSLERQTATSEVLRSISQSPTGYAQVFDTILKNASRLCDVQFSGLFLLRDDHLHLDASLGGHKEFVDFYLANPVPLDTPDNVSTAARCARERTVQHDIDVRNSDSYRSGDELRVAAVELGGIRTLLMVPLFRDEKTLGVLALFRQEVRAFGDDEIELVRTFADQAVIAIENVNLFNETNEALERQTASADILKSISDSPTDVQPVFDAITRNALKLCDGVMSAVFRFDGEQIQFVAQHGWTPQALETFQQAYPRTAAEDKLLGRALLERKVVNVADVLAEFHTVIGQAEMGHRSVLVVPLLREGVAIGAITVGRKVPGLFLDKQIDLVTTFADQAVIAIENVRLFQALEARTADLSKTLERQTATSEILRSISRSPTDYAPVFDTILDNATRLCEAPLGLLFLRRNGHLENVASIGAQPAYVEFLATCQVPFGEQTAVGQAALQKEAVQVEDVLATFQTDASSPARIATVEMEGARTFLAVPMLRDEQVVGVIAIYRREVRRFDDSVIELLETFADQAVIAIENVRLFQTVESRSSELAQSVAELEALGDIAQAVSSSLDVDTVLDTIVTRAVQLSRADAGAINEFDEATGTLPFRAAPGMEHMLEQPAPRLGEGAVGRAAATRAPVQIADITVPGAYTGRLTDSLEHMRIRALLAVPMMQNDQVLGALVVARRTPGEFPPEAVRLLRALGTQSAIAIRNARLFREIEDKGRELEAANRHKSEFLANMSHELRTPLNAVIGFSEVLGERMFGDLNDKQAEYVTDIHDSGRHLLSLINDILDLSKIEAGAMELDLGRFALAPALDNALTLVRERAERRGIVLQAQLEEDLGEMEGDERKLKQILLNLLSNAIKFTGEGGSVTLEARQDDAHVHIAVRDTGVGISEADLAVIFEEFKQVGTDYARKVEGTGLGLTLTQRFVEMHGGHITVTSEPGAGSVFTVVLPLRPVEQAA